MKTSVLARFGALPLVLGLVALGAPAYAPGGGDGDVATNSRAAQVEPEGEGKRMNFVVNL